MIKITLKGIQWNAKLILKENHYRDTSIQSYRSVSSKFLLAALFRTYQSNSNLFIYFIVVKGQKHQIFMSFLHLRFAMEHNTSYLYKHTVKMSSLLLIESLETWNNWSCLHTESILFTKCCTCFLQKAGRFPAEQRDQVEEEWHVLPFTMLIYVSLFELQREVWVPLSSAMSLKPSVFCLLRNPNKVL